MSCAKKNDSQMKIFKFEMIFFQYGLLIMYAIWFSHLLCIQTFIFFFNDFREYSPVIGWYILVLLIIIKHHTRVLLSLTQYLLYNWLKDKSKWSPSYLPDYLRSLLNWYWYICWSWKLRSVAFRSMHINLHKLLNI